ncbi:helix-turn-helix domain-containing protein [Vibrio fortis]|uniref:helix-turn-helix domain-containing protein n=1 Tax=Vibrio fortis TaxID=212667 RepID=UPI0038CD298B
MTIRYKLKELIELKEKIEGKKISQAAIAREIGVQRSAINKLVTSKDYVTTTTTLNALCAYFDCKIEDLVEYVPD